MKKILFVLLMVLSLVISLPAQAEETLIAEFNFDTQPAEGWTSYAGTGAIAEKAGNPQWVAEHDGHTGVMSFDGASSLQLFADAAHAPLLKDYTTLTISFDYFDPTDWQNPGDRDIFYAAADDSSRSGYDYLRFKANTYGSLTAYRPGKDKYNGSQEWNSAVTSNASAKQWRTIKIEYSIDGLILHVGEQTTVSQHKHVDLPTILGTDPVLFLGAGMASNSTGFVGYLDNIKITGSTEPLPEPEPDPDPNPNPNPNPEPVGPSFALNPFNNLGDYRPSLYNGITLDNGSSVERAIIPIPEDNTIILPSDATRESFTIGDKTYAIKDNANNPRKLKLIGWYNIATGEYHNVTDGPATVTLDPEKNNVFYGDWIAESYDFLDGNTTGLITTADTSDFIDVNVFDYSDLVNVNSMTVDQNGGLYSEKWSVYDNRENGWLAFSDWGTYKNGGSIGFPNNRDGSIHGYSGVNANPGILDPADKIISTMFNQKSVPGKNTYVPGINYLGKGNFLFSYDPATGMYSYDCATNAAVYKQDTDPAGDDEGRFYVYDGPITYHSDGEQADFFPLNKKTDSLYKENGVPNYWFGMDFTMDFWLPDNSGSTGNKITNADGTNSDMIFEFEGDDDMWVLIDGKLVLDIGGIHDPVEGTINFSTGDVTVKNENGTTTETIDFTAGDHKMEIYYLERGGDKSNCTIKFNLLPEYEVEEPGIDTVKIVKEWVGNPPTMPAEITVELYDENDPTDVIKTATLAEDEDGNWSHSFSNLPHTNSKGSVIKYSVREKNSNPNFQVNVDGEVHVYSNAWVFTDQAGLKNEKYVVIGNGKGQVLGVDLDAHDVAKIDKDNNIIIKLTEGDANPLLWEIEPAASYTGGKHFYLKNGDQYLCIKLPDSAKGTTAELHLHGANDTTQPSVFYFNASGDLQDATTGHRLVSANGGFGVNTNVGGNVTVESANKASLYVLRESETTAYSFTITNTYVDPNVPMGTLQISKTIGGNAADADDEFTFLVTLKEKDANGSLVTGTFDKYEFVNGQCVVTLTGDKSISIMLPEGAHYTVTETDANGYKLITPANNKYEGTIQLNQTAKCPFHNEKNLYSLTVSKSVSGNAADKAKAFTFTVTLTDANGKALTGKFGEYTFDAKGQCTVSIAHGKSFTIKELPEGAKYTVSENSDGYLQTAPAAKEATGTISADKENALSFTNVRDVVRLVKVTDPTGLTVAPKVTVSGDDGSTVTAEALTANDNKVYLEIPVKPGVTYTVAESGQEVAGYSFVGSKLTTKDAEVAVSGMTFTVAKSGLTTIPVLTLTNTYAQGGLTVSKTVKGNAASTDDEFTFTVTLTDAEGKAVSGTFGEHTFVSGKYTFSLKGGESVSFADLPIGATYTVTEAPAEGYIQTAPTEPATGTISTTPSVASFTNERWAVDIEKKAVGLTGTDTVAPKVTVGDVVIDALPADGKTTERVYVTPGKAYTVAEENAEVAGYTLVSAVLTGTGSGLTVNGMDFVLADTSTEIPVLTLTNTYAQGGLTISKTVKGNAASTDDEFTFTVTLTDADGKAVSGTFGEHTFVDGKATITLKGGESVSFADLPIGATYTVTEAPAEGYIQTAPTAPATGVISTEAAVVSFTNVRDVVRLVKVTDPTGLTVAPKVTVTGDDGSVVTAEALTANNAAKYLEIPVKPGVTYTVAESGQDVAGYTFVGSKLTAKDAEVAVSGMTFTVAKSGLTTIPVLTLSNAYTLDSVTLTIRKVSTGLAEGIAYPAPKVSIYPANSTTPVWTGTLTPNGSALPVKLQPGTYSVKEAIDGVEGYGFTSVLYVNGTASTDKTFALAANAVNTELRLENFYAAEFSTLTLTKTVKGESGSKTGFSFRITLTDDAGKPLTRSFPYTGTLDGTSPISGVVTSGSTVALRDGGSITVQLPLGVHYEVEEQEQEGYVLVSSEGEKGIIEKNGAKAAFVNKPQYTVTVTKVWEGDTADVRPASVQVQLMLNGKPVGDPVTLSAANGWKHTYTGLDAKGPYTVDELTAAEGYVSTVEEGEGNTFVITNSYIELPPTGDAAHPALYLLALVGSAALLLVLLRKRKAN